MLLWELDWNVRCDTIYDHCVQFTWVYKRSQIRIRSVGKVIGRLGRLDRACVNWCFPRNERWDVSPHDRIFWARQNHFLPWGSGGALLFSDAWGSEAISGLRSRRGNHGGFIAGKQHFWRVVSDHWQSLGPVLPCGGVYTCRTPVRPHWTGRKSFKGRSHPADGFVAGIVITDFTNGDDDRNPGSSGHGIAVGEFLIDFVSWFWCTR